MTRPFTPGPVETPGQIKRQFADVSTALSSPIVRDWGRLTADATLDIQIAHVNVLTLGASLTNLTFATSAVPVRTAVRLVIKQDATGSRTIANFVNATQLTGVKPSLGTTANATDYFDLEWTGSTWAMWPVGPHVNFLSVRITGASHMTGFATRVTGNTQDRIAIQTDRIALGTGSAAADLFVSRDDSDASIATVLIQRSVANKAPRLVVENTDTTANIGSAYAPINSKSNGCEITMNSHGTNYNQATLAGWGSLAVHTGNGLQLLSVGDLPIGTGTGTLSAGGYKWIIKTTGQIKPLNDDQTAMVPSALETAIGTTYPIWSGKDGGTGGFASVSFGGASRFVGARSNGTQASPTKVTSGQVITTLAAVGYDNGGNWSAFQAQVRVEATEDWNGATNRGTKVIVSATPAASGTTADVAEFDGSTTAGDTRFRLYDVTAGSLVRVTRGAADSGGVGYRLLRVPN